MVRTRAGYAGGSAPSPTYRNMGDHTEVVQVDFDPSRISYSALLAEFWREHSPEHRPYKRQYMSLILWESEAQRAAAIASMEAESARLGKPLFTEIAKLRSFTRAEGYHQKYYLRGVPHLFTRVQGLSELELTDSTEAARLNAYAGGYGVDPQASEQRASGR